MKGSHGKLYPILVYGKGSQFSQKSFSRYSSCRYIGEECDYAIKFSEKQAGDKHVVQTWYKYTE